MIPWPLGVDQSVTGGAVICTITPLLSWLYVKNLHLEEKLIPDPKGDLLSSLDPRGVSKAGIRVGFSRICATDTAPSQDRVRHMHHSV